MHFTSQDPAVIADIRSFVMKERRMCVSDREWQHRLKGYGYAIRDTARGRMLSTLPHGVDICAVDGL